MTHILEEKEKFIVGDIVSFKDENPEGVSDKHLIVSEIRRATIDDVIILLRCEDNRIIATNPGSICKKYHLEERPDPMGNIFKGCTVRINPDSSRNDKIKNKDLEVERIYRAGYIVVSLKNETEVIVNEFLVNAEDVYIPYNGSQYGTEEGVLPSRDNGISKEKIEEAADYIFRERSSGDSEGKKNDFLDDKLRWDLLPMQDVEQVVRVLHAGAKKYGPNNWKNLPDAYQRYKGAMFRHLMEVEKGNAIDEDTGCLHIAQVVTNALFMLHVKRKEYEGSMG